MKLYFHPGTDMAQAMAERSRSTPTAPRLLPAGTVPPFIMRLDASSVPVGYLVLSSDTRDIDEVQDLSYFRVRPKFASMPGVSAPPPFGGNSADHRRAPRSASGCASYNLSPDEVAEALNSGNTITPVRQCSRQGPDAHRADQLLWSSIRRTWATSRSGSGSNVYLRDLCDDRGRHRHSDRLGSGQRQTCRLHADHQDAPTPRR